MIFGFLTKFWILKNLFRKKIFFLEMKNIFRKSAEKIFFGFFWKVKNFKNFHWKSIHNFRKKSGKNRNFRFFPDFFFEKYVSIVNENFWNFWLFKKNPKHIFSVLFRKIFFISRKNIFFRNKFFKIQNLVRNPKIILRKLYEQYKIV